MGRFMGELGLTPASRARVASLPAETGAPPAITVRFIDPGDRGIVDITAVEATPSSD